MTDITLDTLPEASAAWRKWVVYGGRLAAAKLVKVPAWRGNGAM